MLADATFSMCTDNNKAYIYEYHKGVCWRCTTRGRLEGEGLRPNGQACDAMHRGRGYRREAHVGRVFKGEVAYEERKFKRP